LHILVHSGAILGAKLTLLNSTAQMETSGVLGAWPHCRLSSHMGEWKVKVLKYLRLRGSTENIC